MPIFHFHLSSATGHEVDETGLEFADTDEAYLQAYAGANSMWPELVGQHKNPSEYMFLVTDRDGRQLFVFPFVEALGQTKVLRPKAEPEINLMRNGRLRSDLSDHIQSAQHTLAQSRLAVGRSRASTARWRDITV